MHRLDGDSLMEHPHWNFGVAIACNCGLVLFNLYLLWKIPHWHRKLRRLRRKFTADERQIMLDLEQTRQNMASLPEISDKLISQKQQLREYHQKFKILIQLYRFLSK